MPLSEAHIEQTNRNPDRWVGKAEISGSSNYVIPVTGGSFEEVWVAIRESYYSKRPDERPVVSVVDRAVRNSPPPLDDVGGCAEEIADEKDPDFAAATFPTSCALCGVVNIDWQAHILSPSHIAVMAAHQMPKRKKVLSEEHKRKLNEGRERARLARMVAPTLVSQAEAEQ